MIRLTFVDVDDYFSRAWNGSIVSFQVAWRRDRSNVAVSNLQYFEEIAGLLPGDSSAT